MKIGRESGVGSRGISDAAERELSRPAALSPCNEFAAKPGGLFRDKRCGQGRSTVRTLAAFTMVEIALCLAIIGFALVAIIGVLPTGLNVQKDNREETIINQEATIWMDAIRNGSRGFDDLTNYVLGITNIWTKYTSQGNVDTSGQDTYTPLNSSVTSIPSTPICPLTNGFRIIGLLSTPRITLRQDGVGGFQSNYVVAVVRSMSGYAMEKFPQNNPTLLDAAFTYRFIPQVVYIANSLFIPLIITNNLLPIPIDTNRLYASPATYQNAGLTAEAFAIQTNMISNLENNVSEIRLTFRWPILPGNRIGNGRQTFRLLNGGQVIETNDLWGGARNQPFYFSRPSFYANSRVP